MEIQDKLLTTILEKKEAREIAYNHIKEKYGNIPSLGNPFLDPDQNVWVFPIHVKYPRISFDKVQESPKKVHFMNFENIGKIKINANTGIIVDQPGYYDFRNDVINKLNIVHTTVQKALVKIAAHNFSRLPFSEHMHTPIEDIISYLLLNDKIEWYEDFSNLNDEESEKYLEKIDLLENVGLIRRNDSIILPDNALIEIFHQSNNYSERLANALAFFFYKGYDHIDSIQQVLGPHLVISSFIYEKSVEYGGITEVDYFEIQDAIKRRYSQSLKIVKIPRYLIQLNSVGLIENVNLKGENYWVPQKQIYHKFIGQDSILAPIKQMIIGAALS